MASQIDRRNFVKGSVLASAGAALALQSGGNQKAAQAASPKELPKGKIGDVEVSRILLGGNLLTHYTHSRDLRYVNNLAKQYNTAEKIMETMTLAEQHGVNTLTIHNVTSTMEVLKEHRQRGGKMQWITCTRHALAGGNLDAFGKEIEELVNHGTDMLYISGVEADRLCGYGEPIFGPKADERTSDPKLDLIRQAVNLCKAHGLPTGIGAHRLGVITDCEEAGIEADFYVKTFHHHKYPSVDLGCDSRWCSQPEKVTEVMGKVKKPWIAFKVMAAGAIQPQVAFKYAFENGADFVLSGMFDFEIAQDVRIAKQVLANLQRSRPWLG